MPNFWQQLPRPIFALAPMANVTDAAFRRLIAQYGKPDVMWTEFVSCDGLMSPGRENLLIDFIYSENERPIVAQIFGSKPDTFYRTALLCRERGFDGIDINMGCPDRNVEKQGAGACLMQRPELAQEIIWATQKGAGDLPVSVKTRIGYHTNDLQTWLPHLLETGLAAITIHCRTRQEMSLVPARWEHITEAVNLRDRYSDVGTTLILGNGDVPNIVEAKQRADATGANGVMIGRGIFGNPWCFRYRHEVRAGSPFSRQVTREEKLRAMIEHTYLFEQLLGKHKNFSIMKKHYKAYIAGFDQAKELRVRLMEEADSATAVEKIVNGYVSGLYANGRFSGS